tara:strand:- start:88 stop:288 length:201 start_codon:yes stop_codon:yes gene_type:complete
MRCRETGRSLIGFKTTEPPGTIIVKPGVGEHGLEAFEDAGNTDLNGLCVGKRAVSSRRRAVGLCGY